MVAEINSVTNDVICPFCGRERTMQTVTNYGRDYAGLVNGNIRVEKRDEGCTCRLGKIEHQKEQIKKMCLNCIFFKDGNCTCKKMLDEVSGMFQMPSGLRGKHPERCCRYWKINLDIFRSLIKED